MTRNDIELKLRMPLLNVCLASAAGAENDLREAKSYLLDAVEEIVRASQAAERRTQADHIKLSAQRP